MRCLQCGKELALFKRLTGGEFCSEEHRQAYQRDYSQMALSRLLQSKSRTEKEGSEEAGHAGADRRTDLRAGRRTGDLMPVQGSAERPRISAPSNPQIGSPFDVGLDDSRFATPQVQSLSNESRTIHNRLEARVEPDSDATGYKAPESSGVSTSRPSYSDERLDSAAQGSQTRLPSARMSDFEKVPAAVMHFQVELPNAMRPSGFPIPAPVEPEWTQAPALSNGIDNPELSSRPLDGPLGSGRVDVPVLIHRPSRLLQSGADLDVLDCAPCVRITDRAISVVSGSRLAPVTDSVEIPVRSYPAGQGVTWHFGEKCLPARDAIALGELTRLQFPTAEVDDAEFSNLLTKTISESEKAIDIPETAPLTEEAVTADSVAIPLESAVVADHPLPVPSPLSEIAIPLVPACTELELEIGWPSITDLAASQQHVLHEIGCPVIDSDTIVSDHPQMSPEPLVSPATPSPIVPVLSQLDVEADQDSYTTDLLRASFENAALEDAAVHSTLALHGAATSPAERVLDGQPEPPLERARQELIPVAEFSGFEVSPERSGPPIPQIEPEIEPLVESGNAFSGNPAGLSEFQQEIAAVMGNRWPAYDIAEPAELAPDSSRPSFLGPRPSLEGEITVPVISQVARLAETLAAEAPSLGVGSHSAVAEPAEHSLVTPSSATQSLVAIPAGIDPEETPRTVAPRSTTTTKRFTVRRRRGQTTVSRQRITLPSNPPAQQVQLSDPPKLELNIQGSPAESGLTASMTAEEIALPREVPLGQTTQALELYEPQRLGFFARIKALLGYPV